MSGVRAASPRSRGTESYRAVLGQMHRAVCDSTERRQAHQHGDDANPIWKDSLRFAFCTRSLLPARPPPLRLLLPSFYLRRRGSAAMAGLRTSAAPCGGLAASHAAAQRKRRIVVRCMTAAGQTFGVHE